jgi:hypothetical protein
MRREACNLHRTRHEKNLSGVHASASSVVPSVVPKPCVDMPYIKLDTYPNLSSIFPL